MYCICITRRGAATSLHVDMHNAKCNAVHVDAPWADARWWRGSSTVPSACFDPGSVRSVRSRSVGSGDWCGQWNAIEKEKDQAVEDMGGIYPWILTCTQVCQFSTSFLLCAIPTIMPLRHNFWQTWPFCWRCIWHTFTYWCSMWHIFWYSIWHTYWCFDSLIYIFWHSFWHPMWHLFWRFIWNIFWHCFWFSIWHIFWPSLWHIFWYYYWHSIWQIFCWRSI